MASGGLSNGLKSNIRRELVLLDTRSDSDLLRRI